MNRFLVMTAALAAMTAPAFAADIILPPEPIYVPPAVTDWSGFYAGFNAGVGGGTFEHPFFVDFDPPEIDGSLDVTAFGFLGGVQAGYNYQMDSLVLGIEADIQAANIEGRLTGSLDFGGGNDGYLSGATTVDWFATLRPRLGFANDRFMVYVTGGAAYGSITSSYEGDIGGTFDDSTTTEDWGWTAGIGAEYMLADGVTFKTEYLYTDFGAQSIIDEGDFTLDSNVAFHTVRAGVNFLF
jgi:outer membrane immunogenic protein